MIPRKMGTFWVSDLKSRRATPLGQTLTGMFWVSDLWTYLRHIPGNVRQLKGFPASG